MNPSHRSHVLLAVLLTVLFAGCGSPAEPASSTTRSLDSLPTSTDQPLTPPEPSENVSSAAPKPCASPLEAEQARANEVLVYFACGAGYDLRDFYSFARPVTPGASLDEKLSTAIAAYFDGPTRQEGSEYFTFYTAFEGPTAVNSTEVIGTRAVIDIDFDNRGHSTSAETANIWIALRLLAFQFPAITEMEPRLNGSCEAFGDVVEAYDCVILLRDGATVSGP